MWLYHITKTDEYELVITKNGTICELYPCGKLITTGEAVHPDELPCSNWVLHSCLKMETRS